jgi:hypothetical protein
VLSQSASFFRFHLRASVSGKALVLEADGVQRLSPVAVVQPDDALG